jgi:hypothetical protein
MFLHVRYLLYIAVAGLLSWGALFLVVYKLRPDESTALALGLFFVSLFFALSCSFAVLGYFFRLWFQRNEIFYNHLNIALRQGVLLSVIAVGCLSLQIMRILNWWLGLLLILAVTLLEFYFSSSD